MFCDSHPFPLLLPLFSLLLFSPFPSLSVMLTVSSPVNTFRATGGALYENEIYSDVWGGVTAKIVHDSPCVSGPSLILIHRDIVINMNSSAHVDVT